jgi:hypothetical protein
MTVTFVREFSLQANVTPADALSSGTYNLQLSQASEPKADIVLSAKVVMADSSAGGHIFSLREWNLYTEPSIGEAVIDPNKTYVTGFTGLDADGNDVNAVGYKGAFRELFLSMPPMPNFAYYVGAGINYNNVVVYIADNGAFEAATAFALYPGSFVGFGGLLNHSNGQYEDLGDPKFIYISAKGPVNNAYYPAIEILQLRSADGYGFPAVI